MLRGEIARAVFETLDRSGIHWALWREEPDLEQTHDLDIVAVDSATELLLRLEEALSALDLVPVLHVRYDVNGESFWLYSTDSHRFHQVDVTADPEGMNRLGLPTDRVFASPLAHVDDVHVVAAEWSVIYTVSKRIVKRQWDRAAKVKAVGVEAGRLREVATTVFGRSAARRMLELMESPAGAAAWRRARWQLRLGIALARAGRHRLGILGVLGLRVRRLLGRLRYPAGVWVHLVGSGAAACAEMLGPGGEAMLPRVNVQRFPEGTIVPWLLRTVYPTRIRAGILLTWGDRIGHIPGLGPDLVVDASALSPPEVISQIAHRLGRRVVGRLGGW